MYRPRLPSGTFFLVSAGLGAALMYFYDPQSGNERRARLREKVVVPSEAPRPAILPHPWSLPTRSIAGGLGALMTLAGLVRGGIVGLAYGILGGGLLTRAAANREVREVLGEGAARIAASARRLESRLSPERSRMH